MAHIKELQAFGTSLLSKKIQSSHQLKAKIDKKLKIINNQTNGEIHELFNEIEELQSFIQSHTESKITPNKKQQRGHKRKYKQSLGRNTSENHEPPKKRSKTSKSAKNHINPRIRASIRSSSSVSSSAKTHRKLTMGTTSNTNTSNVSSNHSMEPNEEHDDEHYLHEMLRNAQKAKQLTQNNIDLLQQCIDSVDIFADVLEGDIMKLGDEMRKTFQEFPFKIIPASYQHKMLQEQLRMNRIIAKYPDLEQTERDIYEIQGRYESKYVVKSGEKTILRLPKRKLRKRKTKRIRYTEKEEEDASEHTEDKQNNNGYGVDVDHGDDEWCICKQGSFGKMIRCDNKSCSIQWFHWKCINIRKTPIGKWYCKNCRRYPSRPYLMHRKFETEDDDIVLF